MGIAVTNPDQYESSFKKLFPRGDYWERQFADPQSDTSLFCKVKLPEFIRFRGRMAALQNESKPQSAIELLDEWERVKLGSVFKGLDTQQRQLMLLQKDEDGITYENIQKCARIFGFVITDITLPYHPAFFGFSRFGIDHISSPAAWQVIHIFVLTQGNGDQSVQFEDVIRKKLLANNIPYFFYDGGKP